MKPKKKKSSRSHDESDSSDTTHHRHAHKLGQYLEENDKPRFRSYARKHRVRLRDVRLVGNNTLLHEACRLGYEAFVRYFLKKDCDPMAKNADSNLPLHLAVMFTLNGQNTHAYTDLLLPLIKNCPHALDVANARGDTCRELLQDYKASVIISDSESSDGSSSDPDSTDWSQRMADEMMYEGQHPWEQYWGGFSGTRSGDPENYDQWADRMREEHRAKKYTASQYYNPSRKRKQADTNQGKDKKPKVSEKKRKAFEENMAREREQIRQQKKDLVVQVYRQRIKEYEELCDCLFTDNHQMESLETTSCDCDTRTKLKYKLCDRSMNLRYNDIPWPFGATTKGNPATRPQAIKQDVISNFLFEGLSQNSEEYARSLKTQQRRWHPDRFQQKCGSRLVEVDREDILSTVTQISQVLNKLSEVC